MSDAEYEYSEGSGETSEDLENVPDMKGSDSKQASFDSPNTPFRISVDQHLKNINAQAAIQSQTPVLSFLSDEDFLLKSNRQNLAQRQFIPETTEIAIIDIAHPLHYEKVQSDYSENSTDYIAWTDIQNTPTNEFHAVVHNTYKSLYQEQRKQLRFIHLVSPSIDKFHVIGQNRKDLPIERMLFHYIGYGYPTSNDGTIFIRDSRTQQFVNFKIKKLLKLMKNPSFYIFDCDYAGKFIDSISKGYTAISEKNSNKNKAAFNYDDWLCLCATNDDEKLLSDRNLPRDFLSSCLLSPIDMSLLCHILQFYYDSYKGPDFPLKYFKQTLKEKNFPREDFQRLLRTIVDSIVSDFLKPELYSQLFRKDKLVASLFRNFVLAQYLLSHYNIHPKSNPQLPNMAHHPMWVQWTSALDLWLTSSLSTVTSFDSYFYARSINTFKNMMKNGKAKLIRNSLLTTLCQIPFTDNTSYNQTATTAIADYALASSENRAKVASAVIFPSFFAKLVDNVPIKIKEFDSLCCLVLSLFQYDVNFVFQIKRETNFKNLLNRLFDTRLNVRTKMMIAAILCFFVSTFKNLRNELSSEDHLMKLKQVISEPNVSSGYLVWLLILLKKTYETQSIEPKLFYEKSFHFQLANLVSHNNANCRAAVLSAISCFMQPDDPIFNIALLLFALPTFVDVNFLVRYQFLILIVRFLSTHKQLFIENSQKTQKISTRFSFAEIISQWLCQNTKWPDMERDFARYANIVSAAIHKDDALHHACDLVLYLVDYFAHDPHPILRVNATKAKSIFKKMIQNDMSSSSSTPSISPPFGSLSPSNSNLNNDNDQQGSGNNSGNNSGGHEVRRNRAILNIPNASSTQGNIPSQSTNSVQNPKQTPQLSAATAAAIAAAVAASNSANNNNNTNNKNSMSKGKQTGFNRDESSDDGRVQKPTLFANDSEVIFTIFLDSIIRTRGQDQPKRQDQVVMKPQNYGNISVPTARLQLNASTNQMNQQATHIAFHPHHLNTAFSNSKGEIFYFDEDLNHYQSTILISESPTIKRSTSGLSPQSSLTSVNSPPPSSSSGCEISDLSVLEFGNNPYVVASTSSGCVSIWNPGKKFPSCTWRSDANFMCENIPQYTAVAPNHPKIATVRGNGAITLWDIESQKLIAEWKLMDQNIASKIMFLPSSNDVVLAGYQSGNIIGCDLRASSGLKSARIMNFSLADRLVNFGGNRNGGELIYAASQNGRCVCWNAISKQLNNSINLNVEITNFDVHVALPILAFSRAHENVVLTSPTGQVLYTSKNIGSDSMMKLHPILPVITFSQANGEVSSYNIVLSDK